MVRDDPESFADLDGHNCGGSSTGGQGCNSGFAPSGVAIMYGAVYGFVGYEYQATSASAAQAQNTDSTLKGPFVADLKSKEIAPLLDPNHKSSNSDIVGNGECVAACKKFAGLEGTSTDQWRAGPKVVDDKNIKPGTAIATFDSKGRYPGKDQDKNSGIYLGRGVNGSIWILDQWPARAGTGQQAHPPQPRELRPSGSTVSNSSNAYYEILVALR